MSGRRRKALRRAFAAKHGRPPEGSSFLGYRELGWAAVWKQDELRPIKKAYNRGNRQVLA